jgi:hypothetical protein
MRERSHEDRAQALYNMRIRVKQEHKDVRMNENVVRTLWDIIEDNLDDYEDERPAKRAKRRRKGAGDMEDAYKPSHDRR